MNKRTHKTSAHQNAAGQNLDTQAALGAGVTLGEERGPDGPARPPRIQLNSGRNLHIPESLLDRDNFAYRWFAENAVKGGRVASAEGAYWTMFTDESGHNFRRPSGEDTMYFMQLEIQYWREDQELKKKRVRATLVQETGIGSGEYAPTVDGKSEGGASSVVRE